MVRLGGVWSDRASPRGGRGEHGGAASPAAATASDSDGASANVRLDALRLVSVSREMVALNAKEQDRVEAALRSFRWNAGLCVLLLLAWVMRAVEAWTWPHALGLGGGVGALALGLHLHEARRMRQCRQAQEELNGQLVAVTKQVVEHLGNRERFIEQLEAEANAKLEAEVEAKALALAQRREAEERRRREAEEASLSDDASTVTAHSGSARALSLRSFRSFGSFGSNGLSSRGGGIERSHTMGSSARSDSRHKRRRNVLGRMLSRKGSSARRAAAAANADLARNSAGLPQQQEQEQALRAVELDGGDAQDADTDGEDGANSADSVGGADLGADLGADFGADLRASNSASNSNSVSNSNSTTTSTEEYDEEDDASLGLCVTDQVTIAPEHITQPTLRGPRSTGATDPEDGKGPRGSNSNAKEDKEPSHAALEELRRRVADVTAAEPSLAQKYGGHVRFFHRYLVARDNKVDAAEKMLRETAAFRRERGLDDAERSAARLATFREHRHHWPGRFLERPSADGAPIQAFRYKDLKPRALLKAISEAEFAEVYVTWMERTLEIQNVANSKRFRESIRPRQTARLDAAGTGASASDLQEGGKRKGAREEKQREGGDECEGEGEGEDGGSYDWRGFVEIHDVSGIGMKQLHVPGVLMLSRVLNIGKGHYPDNLRCAFIVGAPFFFSGAWSIISKVLDAQTVEKITVSAKVPRDKMRAAGVPNEVLDDLFGPERTPSPASSFFGSRS